MITDEQFYLSATKFALMFMKSQEFQEEFPAWAYLAWVESGRNKPMKFLRVDFYREKLGRNQNSVKNKGRQAYYTADELKDQGASVVDFDVSILNEQILDLLDRVEDRNLFNMVYVEGMTHREIAKALELTESRISQKVEWLSEHIKEQLHRKETFTLKRDLPKKGKVIPKAGKRIIPTQRMGNKAKRVEKPKKIEYPDFIPKVWYHAPKFAKVSLDNPAVKAFVDYFVELRTYENPDLKRFCKAKALGLNTVSNIEMGKLIPPIEELPKYAKAFELWDAGGVYTKLKALWLAAVEPVLEVESKAS